MTAGWLQRRLLGSERRSRQGSGQGEPQIWVWGRVQPTLYQAGMTKLPQHRRVFACPTVRGRNDGRMLGVEIGRLASAVGGVVHILPRGSRRGSEGSARC